MAQIKINVSEEMLKRCAQEDGDLLVVLDVDPTKIRGFPQPFEVPLRSGRWDKYPDYNSTLCLMKNSAMAYVHDLPYLLNDAAYRAVSAVYSEPMHVVRYQLFAQRYRKNPDEETLNDANQITQSAVSYVNKYFKKNKIPLRFKRLNGNVALCVAKEKEKGK